MRNVTQFLRRFFLFIFLILSFSTLSKYSISAVAPIPCSINDGICDPRSGENQTNAPNDCLSNPRLVLTMPVPNSCDVQTACNSTVYDGCCPTPSGPMSPNPKCAPGTDLDCDKLQNWKCPFCGDGVVNPTTPRIPPLPEQCDPNEPNPAQTCENGGFGNGKTCDNVCNCVLKFYCGDGIVNPPLEECDDGPKNGLGDACDTSCKIKCGNGVIDKDTGETCDSGLGNGKPGDPCDASCHLKCGNNIVNTDTSEQCDHGANNGKVGDSCDAHCHLTCGNGGIDSGEQCDPPNGNTCDSKCQKLYCGDGKITSPRELCDPAATPNGCPTGLKCDSTACLCQLELPSYCGDGKITSPEQCDPKASPNGCTDGKVCDPNNCQCKLPCGDGTVDTTIGEECDPPNGTTCDNNCKRLYCGDGKITNPPEQCDPNASAPNRGCSMGEACNASSCKCNILCGNGTIDSGEQCEPPNTPTCDSNCQSLSCGDGKITPPEQCDPKSTASNKGCADDGQECSDSCLCAPLCGNGKRDPGEECDKKDPKGVSCTKGGNVGSCNNLCQCIVPPPTPAICGDGVVNQPTEQCDDGAANGSDSSSCDLYCQIKCGNKVIDKGEDCDINDPKGPSCMKNGVVGTCSKGDKGIKACLCNATPPVFVCGDGTVNQKSEQCDDGANNGKLGDICDAKCQLKCGNGTVDGDVGEQCDHGSQNGKDGQCDSQCRNVLPGASPDVCGDSKVTGKEECDPAGTACSKDGKSGTCNASCACDITVNPATTPPPSQWVLEGSGCNLNSSMPVNFFSGIQSIMALLFAMLFMMKLRFKKSK